MGRIGACFGGLTTGMKALLASACTVVLLSSGCSAEQPSPPSDPHKEANNTQGATRDEARSDTPEGTTETATPASKEAAGQGAANPEPQLL
jgi:predicted lipid-binding transport protein (Tim44 family)